MLVGRMKIMLQGHNSCAKTMAAEALKFNSVKVLSQQDSFKEGAVVMILLHMIIVCGVEHKLSQV